MDVHGSIITTVFAEVKHHRVASVNHNRDMNSIAERLKSARAEAGLSQQELARRAGCTQSLIGNLEAGTRKSSSHIARLADVLGVTAIWLSDGVKPMRPTAPVAVKLSDLPPETRALAAQLFGVSDPDKLTEAHLVTSDTNGESVTAATDSGRHYPDLIAVRQALELLCAGMGTTLEEVVATQVPESDLGIRRAVGLKKRRPHEAGKDTGS